MGWFFGDSSSFDKAKSNRCFYENLVGKCSSCINMKSKDYITGFFRGDRFKCIVQGEYYPWDERTCRKLIEIDPEEVDCVERYKDFTGKTYYYVSSMIGMILGKNLSEKPFVNIKTLKEISEKDKEKQEKVKLYDIYGMLIATGLFFDPNRVSVCESLMPILNKVSDLVDNKNYDEAFNMYSNMVEMLYNRYKHLLTNASEFDYQNNIFESERMESKKILIRK